MAKQAKAKAGKSRNDDRKNGKAPKKTPGKRPYAGPKPTELQKILMGQGQMVTITKRKPL